MMRTKPWRQDVHNSAVDHELARVGACGTVHLASGRRCALPHGHDSSCQFTPGSSLPQPRLPR